MFISFVQITRIKEYAERDNQWNNHRVYDDIDPESDVTGFVSQSEAVLKDEGDDIGVKKAKMEIESGEGAQVLAGQTERISQQV